MSDNARIIRQIYDAFGRGDMDAVLAVLDPDVRWTEAEGSPYGGTYTDPEMVLEKVFAKLGSEWDGFTAVPAELVSEGDTVVAMGDYRGTFRGTGRAFQAPFVHVWKLRDGRVVTFRQHTDTVLMQRATARTSTSP